MKKLIVLTVMGFYLACSSFGCKNDTQTTTTADTNSTTSQPTENVTASDTGQEKDIMGDFFPHEYKVIDYKEGDMFAVPQSHGKYFIVRILKIDKVVILEGNTINIMGESFTAPEDDYLLIVSETYSEPEFDSVEATQNAAKMRTWKTKIAHIPRRTTGAGEGTYIGNQPVEQDELNGYYYWKESFDKGEAGIW